MCLQHKRKIPFQKDRYKKLFIFQVIAFSAMSTTAMIEDVPLIYNGGKNGIWQGQSLTEVYSAISYLLVSGVTCTRCILFLNYQITQFQWQTINILHFTMEEIPNICEILRKHTVLLEIKLSVLVIFCGTRKCSIISKWLS